MELKFLLDQVSKGLGDWDGKTIVPGKSCEYSTVWRPRPNIDFTSLLKQAGRKDFTIDVQVADLGFAYAYAQVLVDESCKLDQEWITNSCETIEQDEKCTLKNETIDGVQTYKNYHPTDKTPIAISRQIGGGSCDLEVERSWWRVEREYDCKTNIDLSFDEGIQRNVVIQDSVTSEGFNEAQQHKEICLYLILKYSQAVPMLVKLNVKKIEYQYQDKAQ